MAEIPFSARRTPSNRTFLVFRKQSLATPSNVTFTIAFPADIYTSASIKYNLGSSMASYSTIPISIVCIGWRISSSLVFLHILGLASPLGLLLTWQTSMGSCMCSLSKSNTTPSFRLLSARAFTYEASSVFRCSMKTDILTFTLFNRPIVCRGGFRFVKRIYAEVLTSLHHKNLLSSVISGSPSYARCLNSDFTSEA